MNLVRRLFPFRTCTIDIREGVRALQRPCLLYHIKRCQGPCIEAISKADYRADIEQVELFLEGRQESLVKALRDEMKRASERQDYERGGDRRGTRSRRSSGRWRARRWRRSPGPTSTSWASPGATTRPRSSCSSIRGGKALGPRRLPARHAARRDRRGGRLRASCSSTTPARPRAAGDRGAAGAAGRRRPRAVPRRSARATAKGWARRSDAPKARLTPRPRT